MQTEFSTESPPRRPVALDSEADLDRFVDAHAVATINPRDDPSLIEQFGITSVPTLVLFEGGAEVGRLAEGFQGGDAIDAFLSDPADANVDTDA